MKIMLIAGLQESLLNFRGHLISTLIEKGHTITAAAGETTQEATKILSGIGVNCIDLQINRTAFSPFSDLLLVLRLLRFLRKDKPDVIIAYTIKAVIYGSIASKFTKNVKVYPMITGLGYSLIEKNGPKAYCLKKLIKFLYKFSLSGVENVFFQNCDDITFFRQNRLLNSKTRTHRLMGSGVDLDAFAQTEVPNGNIIFLMVARLLREKGIEEFVDASKSLKHQFPDAQFWVVGDIDSNPSSVSQECLDKWQKDGSVTFYGGVSNVKEYLSKCSVFVLPSYREGLPRSTLEAMATGRAIITTDVPGCRDTVKEGVNGVLVPKQSSEALMLAMTRFIVGDFDIAGMGRESRQIAETHFNVHSVNKQIIGRLEK